MSQSELQAKKAELASFRRFAIPVFAIAAIVSLLFMLDALMGKAIFPPVLRTILTPAFFIAMLVSIPLGLKQGRLVKEIKSLGGG